MRHLLLIIATVMIFHVVNLRAGADEVVQPLALELYSTGNLDSAEVLCLQLIVSDASCPTTYICLGNIYFARGQMLKKDGKFAAVGPVFTKAIKYYSRALMLQPGNLTALINIGMSYYELNQFNPAERYFREVLEIDPNNPAALQNMGNALFWVDSDSADYEKAGRYWNMALQARPADDITRAVILTNIGIAYYKMGRIDSAIYAYTESIGIDSNSPGAYVLLGRAIAMSNLDKAIELYRKALALDSLYVPAFGAWAEALYIMNDNTLFTFGDKAKELRDFIKKALKDDPDNAAAYHLYLGDLYMAENKFNRAEAEYEKAGELNPYLRISRNY